MTHMNINNCFEEKRTFFVSVWNYRFNMGMNGFDESDDIVEIHNEIIQLDPVEDADIKTKNDIERIFRDRFPYDYIDIYPLRWEYNGISFVDKP